MDKTYNPADIESRWYNTWEKNGYFAPKPGKGAYCIMIPPPNVTGSLHMGHAFQDTLMDILTRYHRMQGESTLWQVGTDHAGIATQMVVERQLAAQGISRHDLGREKFIEKIWQWKKESGGTITRQLRRLGASLDWSRERFTMDDGLSESVKEVFVRLYEEGLIYRGKRLVNWDTVLHTAVSDLEVISEEETGHMWHMRYPLASGEGNIIVATTRPETMLGDAAVAVNPDDERYQHLVGQWLILPLTHRKIPIIADHHVDKEFGTGCVKITPAHDFNDYQVWQRHKNSEALSQVPCNGLINILTKGGEIISCKDEGDAFELIPQAYRGLDRFEARKRIVADLEKMELLDRIEPHKLMVPRGDRSHTIIEPYLTDQWFVRTAPLAKPAIEAVEKGDIRFVPENWSNTYFEWMRNIEDWCISRQIWWGHRIPAWYDKDDNIYVGRDENEVRAKYQLDSTVVLTQDNDVLDTWFSSALWPFSTLGWPEKTDAYNTFYPTNVLVTGFDIIFFWVARMIMMGLKFTGQVPFKEVYIHGLVRDAEGQKMSKSKGNVLDPIDVIDGIDIDSLVSKRVSGLMQPEMAKRIKASTLKHFPDGIKPFGTDALRFTFAALASTGRDIRFDMGRVEGYRNFCNKLWNAARYVFMNTDGKDTGIHSTELELSVADKWIISRFQHTLKSLHSAFANYRFDIAASAIYEFIWNEYCDWYLELSKAILTSEQSSEAQLRGTRHTLVTVLEATLRIAHPLLPFITEEIWQKTFPLVYTESKASIMLEPYPIVDSTKIDPVATQEMEWVMSVVLAVRKIRGEMNIAPRKGLTILLQNASEEDKTLYQNHHLFIQSLAKIDSVSWLGNADKAPESATALIGKLKLLIPIAGLIDKAAEEARLRKEIEKINKDKAKTEAKLNNPKFMDRAPESVIEQERTRLIDFQSAINSLNEQLNKIASL